MGMAIGVAAGVAAGLLAAPMRGSDMRARLRSRADSALDHGLTLLEEGRRAFRTSPESSVATPSGQLSATLGEIAAYAIVPGLLITLVRANMRTP